MFLLDTNVISETRKLRPHGGVIEFLEARKPSELFISAVSIGEMQEGVEMTRRQNPEKADEIEDWITQTVENFPILPMDAGTFREWAVLMQGTSGDLSMDAMIAATARTNRLTVVTRNTRDFSTFHVLTLNPFVQKA